MTNRRSYLILIGLILAALAAVAAMAIPGSPAHKKATLGLDLQGGLEVVLKAVPEKGTELILYCGGGFRSALAAEALQRMGYYDVSSMAGGWKAWNEAGAPIEKD